MLRQSPRKRYVSDDEFLGALDRAPDYLQELLWFAYLTGLRQKDCMELARDSLQPVGILLEESKGGHRTLVAWTDALRDVVDKAKARHNGAHVFGNSQGEPWTKWALQSALRRLNLDWTFHDLRAKAESDHETGLGLLARYRRVKRIKPVF